MAINLEIDSDRSPIENIVALIHYTYPKAVGYIDTVNYTFEAASAGDLTFGNTYLHITALPSATLTGSKSVEYLRRSIDALEYEYTSGTIDTYEDSIEFPLLGNEDEEWTRTSVEESDARVGTLYTYAATADSLLYTGEFTVFVAAAAPTTVEELIDGSTLDGFSEPA